MLNKLVAMLFVIVTFGCNDNTKIRPDDFALGMVNGIIKSGVTDGRNLEEKVNDSAINNVDTDKDGKADYIIVKDEGEGPHHHLTYVAHPSSGQDVPFAKTSFVKEGDAIEVHSTFLPIVADYEEHYYHDTMGHDMLFALWLYDLSRPAYISYIPRTYIYRRTVSTSTFVSVQRTYQTRYNISPTVRQSRPSSFNPSHPSNPSHQSQASHRDSNSNSNSHSASPNRVSRPSVSVSRHR